MRIPRGILVLGLTVAVALSAGAALGANVVKIRSKVTIAADGLRFHGKVLSPNAACEQGRKVKLKREVPGKDPVFGTSTTDAQGRWEVTVSGFAGVSLSRFYARVRRRSEGTAGTIFVCRSDRSRSIRPG
ncbi:MAG TPA: hypothetical protein VKA89_07780 [Solirubrobacterales bacterium]|nr:hypothetical protein [Solirubrobacterales bacterium]